MRKMKDSGVAWIGEIPEGWEVGKFKHLFDFGRGLPITKENLTETGIAVINYGQIHSKQNKFVRIEDSLFKFVPKEYIFSHKESLVFKNDFIFADTSEDVEGIGNYIFINIDSNIFSGYHTIICRPKFYIPSNYIAYLFSTNIWRTQLRQKASGIKVFSITQHILKDASILLPPIETQVNISSYLDRKCAQIDEAIALVDQSIEKLKAYRQSVITEAVTRGLDPDAKMKDSGVAWIGEIPEGWEVSPLGAIFKERKKINNKLMEKNVLSLSYGKIIEKNIESNIGLLPTSFETYNIVEEMNIVLRLTDLQNDKRSLRVGYVEKQGIITSAYVTLEIKTGKFTKFFYYLLHSYDIMKVFYNMGNGVRQNLNYKELFFLPIIYPNANTQHQIADYLDRKCAQIDDLISQKQSLRDKLTAYKKSLIYECVTGKREVA